MKGQGGIWIVAIVGFLLWLLFRKKDNGGSGSGGTGASDDIYTSGGVFKGGGGTFGGGGASGAYLTDNTANTNQVSKILQTVTSNIGVAMPTNGLTPAQVFEKKTAIITPIPSNGGTDKPIIAFGLDKIDNVIEKRNPPALAVQVPVTENKPVPITNRPVVNPTVTTAPVLFNPVKQALLPDPDVAPWMPQTVKKNTDPQIIKPGPPQRRDLFNFDAIE